MTQAALASPEAAAVAEWPTEAQPRVVSVETRRDKAEVVLDVNADYRYWSYLRRQGDGWVEINSGNGPNLAFWNEAHVDG